NDTVTVSVILAEISKHRLLYKTQPVFSNKTPNTAMSESLSAEPSAKPSVPRTQNTSIAPRIIGFGPLSQTISTGTIARSDATRRSEDQSQSSNPHTPPSSAKTNPSMRSCLTILARMQLWARRIAFSLLREQTRERQI